ncbi:DUF481 domain-containing protein [Belliella buryatensis]|nr:DUF481 domain-containing protein [Belliella buryatensis]
MKLSLYLFIVFLLLSPAIFAQNALDSVVFQNNNYLVGEIKSLEKGVLTMKTPFSKENFKIKWLQVTELYSEKSFLLTTKAGFKDYGKVKTLEKGQIKLLVAKDVEYQYAIEDIVAIKPLESSFLSRFNAALDMGFSLTRSRNQRQFTLRSRFGYTSKKWSFDASYNKLYASQEGAETIRRGDGYLTSLYSLNKDWLGIARIDYLYNTEQLIDIRLNNKIGIGNYLLNSNRMQWTALGGISYNLENFDSEISRKRSVETWIGTELNIFDIKKVSLNSTIFAYPSLTERNRIRVDYRFDIKYDLPLDFYLKTGTTINYDRQPVGGASSLDYVFQTTFGWSFSK